MTLRSRHLQTIVSQTDAHAVPERVRIVGERACSKVKRTRVPRHLKVWALQEQTERKLSDKKTAQVLTELLIQKNLLSAGRSISRTAVVDWRKRLKGMTPEEAGQSLSFRPPLYKELREAARRLITSHLERCGKTIRDVKFTQGDIKGLASILLPMLTEILERRIVNAVEEGDLEKADSLRPALCTYSRCCLSLNWARQVRRDLIGKSNISSARKRNVVPLSSLPQPEARAIRECVLYGLSFLDFRESGEGIRASLGTTLSHLNVQLGRSRVRIEQWEVSRLVGDGWLTDSVVYAYCKLVEKRNRGRWVSSTVPRLWAMDPILFCKVLRDFEREGRENVVKKMRTQRRFFALLSDISQAEVLAFPLARSRSGAVGKRTSIHWTVLVISRPLRQVWHLCSLHGEDGPCGEYESAASMCTQFIDSLTCVQDGERCQSFARVNNKIFGRTVPKQVDSSSCGAYVCHFVDTIEKNRGLTSTVAEAKALRTSILAALISNQVKRKKP